MSGSLQHPAEAVVVAEAGQGWFFYKMKDGSIVVRKYQSASPHEGDMPQSALSLNSEQWERLVVELT